MEPHSFTSTGLTNRERFRRSLQSSLHDALGFVGAFEHDDFGRSPLAGASASSFPQPTAVYNPSTSLCNNLGLGLNRTSMLHQPSPYFGSHFGSQEAQDRLLLKHAEKQLVQAQAAVLLQRMAQEKRQQSLRDALLVKLLHVKREARLQQQLEQHQASSFINNSSLGVIRHQDQFYTSQSSHQPVPASKEETEDEKHKRNAYTLHALGNHLRSRNDPFIDCLDLEDPNDPPAVSTTKTDSGNRRSRGGVSEHFPERLHRMLNEVEDSEHAAVVSFLPHGRAFRVHDMERFVGEILPKYFKQTQWNSFARQLSLYGFIRVANGPDAGGYYHELFLRSRPSLCLHMRRVGVPQDKVDRRKCRPKNVADLQEPNFYRMKTSERVNHVAQK